MKILLALVTCLSVTWTASASGQDAFDAALPRQVEVIRTAYGVPHIYADTLRALGYALGYLQSEDYGDRVARGLLRARGELALHEGRGALDSDFASRPSFTRAVEVYPALHPDTRAVYEGFAIGVNRYMAQHPEEFADWVTSPFTGYDRRGAQRLPSERGSDPPMDSPAERRARGATPRRQRKCRGRTQRGRIQRVGARPEPDRVRRGHPAPQPTPLVGGRLLGSARGGARPAGLLR